MDTQTMHTLVIIGAVTLAAVKLVGRAKPKGLIEPLPSRLEKRLRKIVEPGEEIHVQLVGAFQQALICTDTRVILLKAGWMTGQLFGGKQFQQRYRSINGAELQFEALTGFFELSSGGMQNTPRSFMSKNENRSATKAPNCIAIYRTQASRFQEACNFIMARVDQAFSGAAQGTPAPDAIAQIARLAELRDKGTISPDEFATKKAELLAKV